jgi:hypothetical protein
MLPLLRVRVTLVGATEKTKNVAYRLEKQGVRRIDGGNGRIFNRLYRTTRIDIAKM